MSLDFVPQSKKECFLIFSKSLSDTMVELGGVKLKVMEGGKKLH